MGIQEIDKPGSTSSTEKADEVAQLRAERDALRAELDRSRHKRISAGRIRRVVVIVLVILASISGPIAVSAAWTRRTLLNTDQWVKTVTPIIDHAPVREAMSRRITAEVMTLVNADEVVQDALPPRAQLLAAPMTDAVTDFVGDQVNDVLASERFRNLWVNANRFAHAQIVAVLRGEGEVVTSSDGEVVLNLVPVINEVLARVEARGEDLFGRDVNLPEITSGEVPDAARQKLEDALGVSVPADLGEIVVYESNRLEVAQDAVKTFDRTVILLVLLAIAIIIAALAISKTRRRTVIQMCTGMVLGLVILRRSTMYVQDQAVDLARPENRDAAGLIVDDLMRGFFSLTRLIIIVLIATIAICLITGTYGWAVSLRQWVRELGRSLAGAAGREDRQGPTDWVRTHRDVLQVGGVIVLAILFLVVDVSWPIFLLGLALLAVYELAVHRIGAVRPAPSGS